MVAIQTQEQLRQVVDRTIKSTPISDVHTHLFSEDFGDLLRWGIDELLTSPNLAAEMFRFHPDLPYEEFGKRSKQEQADLIWKTLFIDHAPHSEACRGVLTVLSRLDLDASRRDLSTYREFFSRLKISDYMDLIFKMANVTTVCMTNNPFSASERQTWERMDQIDPRFNTSLGINPLLNHWESTGIKLKAWGYEVEETVTEKTCREIRSFLKYWIAKMNPLYMSVSLPPSFVYPEVSVRSRILEQCILPVAREADIPLAMMIDSQNQLNSGLGTATGCSTGKFNLTSLEQLCVKHSNNKFIFAQLSPANPYELMIATRSFRNLHVFGCGWFLNSPRLLEEMTRVRLEMLGASVTTLYSDSGVLDQLLYKWDHSRRIIGKVLYESYCEIMDSGWRLTDDEVRRDVADLFGESFWRFLGRSNPAVASKLR